MTPLHFAVLDGIPTAPVAEVKSAHMGADMDAHDGPDEVRDTSRAPGLGDPSFGDGRAPCETRDPEIWFRTNVGSRELAKAYCQRACPFVDACLARALEHEAGQNAHERHGIWGGKSPAERARLDPTRRRPGVVRHCPWPGYARGLERHAALDEAPCPRCKTYADERDELADRERRALALREADLSIRSIATVLKTRPRTVRDILARHQETETA